jgi:hypothetical protein
MGSVLACRLPPSCRPDTKRPGIRLVFVAGLGGLNAVTRYRDSKARPLAGTGVSEWTANVVQAD